MRTPLLVSAIFAGAVAILAAQGGADAPTTVNLGGGSNWRGAVPNGPVPRLPDGTVSLEGVWQGGGPSQGLAQGLPKGEIVPMLPWAKAKMAAMKPGDSTEANCLPATTPRVPSNYPWRLVQYPTHTKATHIFMLFEANIHSFRQIFMDGRKHPPAEELDPSWYGHSIGWWEGDTLVVDSVGFNDRGTLDGAGAPQTTKKHVIERWTRKDLGHMVNEITIDDPGAYSRPFTLTFEATLRVGDEMMEYICNENNQYGIAGGKK
jgi:hypothetical protein